GLLSILTGGAKRKSEWNPVSICNQSHLNDRIRSVFFALSILFITVFLFNLEVVLCAIIIKNFIVSLPQEETVFVNFRLYKITLFCKDRKGAVDIMEFIGWCLQELLCSLERRSFAGRLQDSGVDQVREDRIQVIFKFVTVSDLSADGIHLQTIIDRLEEEITASKKIFSVIVHKSVGMERRSEERRVGIGLRISASELNFEKST